MKVHEPLLAHSLSRHLGLDLNLGYERLNEFEQSALELESIPGFGVSSIREATKPARLFQTLDNRGCYWQDK